MSNANINLNINGENRGLNFLFGLISIVLFVKWWFTGTILFAVNGAYSATSGVDIFFLAVWPLLADLIAGIGAFVVLVVSGVWSFVWQVINHVFVWLGKKSTATVATSAQAVPQQTNSPPIDPEKLKATFKQIKSQLDELGSQFRSHAEVVAERLNKVDPPAPPPPTQEEVIAQLTKRLQELESEKMQPTASRRRGGES